MTVTDQFRLCALVHDPEPQGAPCFHLALWGHSTHSKIKLSPLLLALCVRQGVWANPQVEAVELVLGRSEKGGNVVFIVFFFLVVSGFLVTDVVTLLLLLLLDI